MMCIGAGFIGGATGGAKFSWVPVGYLVEDLYQKEEERRRDQEPHGVKLLNEFLTPLGICGYILSVHEPVCINNMLCIIGSVI